MQRLFVLIFVLSGISFNLFSQNRSIPNFPFISAELYPEPSASMPDWMNLFFQENLNLKEIDAAFDAYYDLVGFDEEKDGEEHNPYVKFYSKFRRNAMPYMLPDGTVQNFTVREWKALRKKSALNKPSNSLFSSTANWTHLGPKITYWRKEHRETQPVAPWQVNIYAFDIAPSNTDILYAGTETSGIYKTTDKGLNWKEVGTNFNFGSEINAVAIHPTDPNTVYVSAGSEIFNTIDGGATWSSILTVSGLSAVDIEIHPTLPNIILAATWQGVYRSTNSGANWTQVESQRCYDIAFKEDDPSTVFLIKRNNSSDQFEFYKSTNTGASFSLITNGWITGVTEQSGARLTTTAHDANYIYIVLLTSAGPRIMKSIDAGNSWATIATGETTPLGMSNGQGFYDLDIEASDTNKDQVIVATTTCYRSTDGGINYTAIGGFSGSFDIHPDIQEIKSIGTDTWLSTDGGIFYSSDFFNNTANAGARINGIDGTEFWGFDQGWQEDIIVGGRYHNGNTALYENYPSGLSLRMGGAESATGWVMHGRSRHTAFSDLGDGIIIPEDWTEEAEGRFTFSLHPNEGSRGYNASEVLIHPHYFETYYVGSGQSIWISENGGNGFSELYNFGSSVRKMEISRSNPDVLYVATDAALMKTSDGGTTWSSLSLPAGFDVYRMSLSVSAADEDILWILDPTGSNGAKVYKTINGGSSWTNLTTGTLNGMNFINIAHAAGTNGGVYIASWGGVGNPGSSKVFYRNNTHSDWQAFSDGLPEGFNPLKTIPFYRDGKLRMGGNRGAWETDLFETFSPIVQPTVDKNISNCGRDTFYFSDYSVAMANATWSWSFPGASFVSSTTSRNPKVVYDTDGSYDVTLTITQGGSSDTKTITEMVTLINQCGADESPGSAISFPGGGSDYISADPLNVNTNNITFSAWIKRSGDQTSSSGLIFTRGGTTTSGFNFNDNNELGYHWDGSQWWWDSGLVVPENKWTHVVLVITPTNATIYMDEEVAVNNASHTVEPFDASLRLGADPHSSPRRFKGDMDEVAIWNRALTIDEIRDYRHLVKDPTTDPTLLLYYQFNEASGEIIDRAGINHGSFNGTVGRMTSTAPVGGGTSARMTVNSGGIKDFTGTDLILEFPASGTYPNGELVVTKVTNAPDQNAGSSSATPNTYWVINNYGTNNNFSELTSLQFNGLTGINSGNTSSYQLHKRGSNNDGASWGSPVDNADAASPTSLSFTTGNGITSFSQFTINNGAPLPVELIDFTVTLNPAKEAVLKWTTASEINNSHFNIERSSDGISFEKIGIIAANNISTTTDQHYTFVDQKPLRGINYYRLEQVDFNARTEHSPIRSILINSLPEEVVVYPNPLPNGQALHIKTSWTGLLQLKLYNGEGKKIKEVSFEGDAELFLGNLPKGWYGYQIQGATRLRNGVLFVF